ncbi:MAG: hypothetical protein K8F60_08510 [Melioribacteraceae bacterium]|nr:hypothetical protein [Ignavibacteriota bacterium]MBZ0182484.1 hypothetical protein [Melioribacteraceae bacterium]
MKRLIITSFLAVMVFTSCSVLQTVMNVSRLKFKVNNVNEFKVLGISIKDKQKLSDFNPLDIIKLTASVAKGELPVTFTLFVEAENPNDGTGGYPATDITLKSFPAKLYIDDKLTVTGNIGEPVVVPGVGENKLIPINIDMDLMKFFKDKGLESIINLALNLGGQKANTSAIKLITKPVIGTPLGDLEYPDEITVVDQKFN